MIKLITLILALSVSGCAYSTKSPDDRNYELIICAFARCDIDKSERKTMKTVQQRCIDGSINLPHQVDVPCY